MPTTAMVKHKSMFTPSKRRYRRFKDGKLIEFNRTSVRVYRPWPDPCAWEKGAGTIGWHNLLPDYIEMRIWDLEQQVAYWKNEKRRRRSFKNRQFHEVQSVAQFNEADVASDALPLVSEEGLFLAREKRVTPKWKKDGKPDPLAQYIEAIPSHVKKAIRGFAYDNFNLLKFIYKCGDPAIDLLVSNPALAIAFSRAEKFIGRKKLEKVGRFAWMKKHMHKKQRELCRLLGLPSTESFVRLLKKVQHKRLVYKHLTDLRNVQEECLSILAHAPFIYPPSLGLFFRFWRHLSQKATIQLVTLQEPRYGVNEEEEGNIEFGVVGVLLRDTVRMYRGRARGDIIRFESLEHLKKLHDEQIVYVNRDSFSSTFSTKYEFPDPPFPSSFMLTPITTQKDLEEEGRSMHHCVASYASSVADKECYIYHVEVGKEKATLELSRSFGLRKQWIAEEEVDKLKEWKVEQIHGVANAKVSSVLVKEVVKWASAYGVELGRWSKE